MVQLHICETQEESRSTVHKFKFPFVDEYLIGGRDRPSLLSEDPKRASLNSTF